MATTVHPPVVGVILAGGLARRMGGGDKPLRTLGGRSLLARVIDRLAPQCETLILNANGDPARFADLGLPVVADDVADYPGPLAGILAGLDWMAMHRPDTQWMLSAPGDCPFLPRDLAARLHRARRDADSELAVAASGGRTHHVVGLWPVNLRQPLRDALVNEDLRQVGRFMARHRLVAADWPVEPLDRFFNANTAEDLAQAERLIDLDD